MKITEHKKLLIYKIILFSFAFIISFLPATASRNLEVNNRVIVEMIGLDDKDGDVEITAQYVMPTGADKSTAKDKVTVSAGTVTEAVENLSTALGRRAELGHCSIIILGSKVKPEVLGSIMTGTDITADAYLAAAKEKASDIIGDMTDFMSKSDSTDADFIAYSAKRSHIATTTLLRFMSDIGSASNTAFVPVVEMIKEQGGSGGSGSSGGSSESGGSSGSSGSSGGSSGEAEKPPTGLKIEKLALYDENGRVGELKAEAARGVAWVCSQVEKSIISADVEYGDKVYKGVSGRLKDKKAKINISDGEVEIKLDVRIDARCDKYNELKVKDNGKGSKAVERAFAEKIKKEVEKGYGDGLTLGADPMFIGREIYRFEPELFDSFSLADTPVKVNVKVTLN